MVTGLPSRQTVNGVGGRLRARDVSAGRELWALAGTRSEPATVRGVAAEKVRELVSVATGTTSFLAAPGQLFLTPAGWVPAAQLEGAEVAHTAARKLNRRRLSIVPGHALGYFLGATCADGTVGKNYVSLVVNDEAFAARFAASCEAATGLSANIEAVSRPSGYLAREVPGFRVRVVSSYLADLMRQYAGGDAHHMRQRFPRVVLRDRTTFDGFLDGYADGDGCRAKGWRGRVLVSANVPFLQELATVIGARFTPARGPGRASHLCVVDDWPKRGSFVPESHPTQLVERQWARVSAVTERRAEAAKPFTVYRFRLEPHGCFLVQGHLAHSG